MLGLLAELPDEAFFDRTLRIDKTFLLMRDG
jgi:hypothetical protein